MNGPKMEHPNKARLLLTRKARIDCCMRINLNGTKNSNLPIFDDYTIYYFQDGTIVLEPILELEYKEPLSKDIARTFKKGLQNDKKGEVEGRFKKEGLKDLEKSSF